MTNLIHNPDREEFYRLTEQGQAVVLFTAPAWCQPCRQFEPHWLKAAEIARDKKTNLLFITIDMGESPDESLEHWASQEYNILAIPQVLRIFHKDDYEKVNARSVIPLLKELESYE